MHLAKIIFFIVLCIFVASPAVATNTSSSLARSHTEVKEVNPITRVTMIDLGADSCIPCKMMAPILVKLKEEYKNKADIVFIDVWKNPAKGQDFGIRLIPTQIFFDKHGNEIKRHEGFLDEQSIRAELEALLKE